MYDWEPLPPPPPLPPRDPYATERLDARGYDRTIRPLLNLSEPQKEIRHAHLLDDIRRLRSFLKELWELGAMIMQFMFRLPFYILYFFIICMMFYFVVGLFA